MRILQVNSFYEERGGAEVYLHQLRRALVERGHAVGLFAGTAEHPIDEPDARVLLRPEFDSRRLVRDPDLSATFAAFAGRFEPDLVHVHNLWTFPAELAVDIGRLGVPVVQTVHDFNVVCPNSGCVLPDGTPCAGGPGAQCFANGCQANYPFDARVVTAVLLRYRILPRLFDAFLCPSRHLADVLERHGFPRTEHLPLFVDGVGREAPPTSEREPGALLYVGRLAKEKGVVHLIDALPRVVAACPTARLSIVGDGPEAANLGKRARRLGLAERVTFHGRVPREEVAAYYRSSAVLVVPSVWSENAPLAVLESLGSSLPLVASRVGGLPDLVVDGEMGLLATPRDPDDLAEKLIRVLTDGPLRERLARGCAAARERFSRAKHMDRIEAIYGESLRLGHRAHGACDLADEDVLATLDRLTAQLGDVEDWLHGARAQLRVLGPVLRVAKPVRRWIRKLAAPLRPGVRGSGRSG